MACKCFVQKDGGDSASEQIDGNCNKANCGERKIKAEKDSSVK